MVVWCLDGWWEIEEGWNIEIGVAVDSSKDIGSEDVDAGLISKSISASTRGLM